MRPLLIGLLFVLACVGTLTLGFRLLGLGRAEAFYGACVIVVALAHGVSHHLFHRGQE